MRILIATDGQNHKNYAYALPWRDMATCFNFKPPTKTVVAADNIKDLTSVESVVFVSPLDDYSFIAKMDKLEQLYIYDGTNISDLSFLKSLMNLKHLCIFGAHIDSLDDIAELIQSKYYAYEPYKDLSPREEFEARWKYGFEAIYIESDLYKGTGNELVDSAICRAYVININGTCLEQSK